MTFPKQVCAKTPLVILIGVWLFTFMSCAKSQPQGNSSHHQGGDSLQDFERMLPFVPDTSSTNFGDFQIEQVQGNPFHTLMGHFEGNDSTLIAFEDSIHLELSAEEDLDEDGYMDLVLRNNAAWKGQCCLHSYFIASYRGNGRYTLSHFRGNAFHNPVIERWKGKWSVIIDSLNSSLDTIALLDMRQRFIFHDGELEMAEKIVHAEIDALAEIRAAAYDSFNTSDTLRLVFDIDSDGKSDVITANLWERWGRLRWSIHFGNGKTMLDGIPARRLGVLPSITQGCHDLVVDFDRVLVWNGKRYEERED